jgi:hypothetical protein
MNSNLYAAINTMLSASGSSIGELLDYHFKNTENKTTEVKVEAKSAMPSWKPIKEGTKWGDLSEDEEEEDEEYPRLGAVAQKEQPEAGNYLTVVSSSTVRVESNVKATEEELKGFFTKAPTRKQGLPVVYSVSEFIEEIKQGNAPGKDFVIDESAHCEHTFKGSLCENVRRCGKIHVQRCVRGSECKSKHCSYLHEWDMEDEEAERIFRRTMRKYNMLKASKQVK